MIQSTISGHKRMSIPYISYISMAMAFGVLFSCFFFPFHQLYDYLMDSFFPLKPYSEFYFEHFDVFMTFPCPRYCIYRLTWRYHHEKLEIYDAPIHLRKSIPAQDMLSPSLLFVTRHVDFMLIFCYYFHLFAPFLCPPFIS